MTNYENQIIAFAEQAGLLIKDQDYPYTSVAHARKIEQLKKFAEFITASAWSDLDDMMEEAGDDD